MVLHAVACAPGEVGPMGDAGTAFDAGLVVKVESGIDAGAAQDAGMSTPPDSGLTDSGVVDSGVVDSGVVAPDAGTPDAGMIRVAWNSDSVTGGAGWAAPAGNPIAVQSQIARSGSALFWDVLARAEPWSEWGWNWKAWQTPGTDVSTATMFSFALRLSGTTRPHDLVVSLRSAINQKYAHQPPSAGGLRGINVRTYDPDFADGAWHQIVVPMADMLSEDNAADFREVYEIFIGAGGSDYQLYLDELEFR